MNAANPSSMRRFVLCHNIERLTEALRSRDSKDNSDYIRNLVRRDQRDLALLDAGEYGAFNGPRYCSNADRDSSDFIPAEFAFDDIEPDLPIMILASDPGLQILYANEAFSTETGIPRSQLVGRPVYEAFPENPEALEAESICHTLNSIHKAVDSKQSQILPNQRYDIRNSDGVLSNAIGG